MAAYELIVTRAGGELSLNDLRMAAIFPIHVLPRLRAGQVQKALGWMRRRNPAWVARVENYIADLTARLDEFPKSLNVKQQSQYVLGEAHQQVVGLPV
jgi:hypothetical protein